MKIHGLQKMTLLDFPGRVACTVFLGGCDFRCPYCHNFELVDGTAPAIMEEGALFDFLKKRRGLLDGVAVTGGEPTLRSVAFCCISTGVFRFPHRRAAEIAVQTVEGWLAAHPGEMDRVVFNVFKDEDRGIYEELLRE